MSSGSDGDFDDRLRRVLHEHRQMRTDIDTTLGRVHDGARRRQRRRATASAVAAVVLIAGGGSFAAYEFAGRDGTGDVTVAIGSPDASTATPTASAPPTAGKTTQYSPVSVTAISATTFWVLTDKQCDSGDPQFDCEALLQTTDGGKTFQELFTFEDAAKPGSDLDQAVRFGSSTDGWLIGPQRVNVSHDGGLTWSDSGDNFGLKTGVVAAAGHAWLVADTTDDNNSGLALFQQAYGARQSPGTNTWKRVSAINLPPLWTDGDAFLAVQGNTVAVVTSGTGYAPTIHVSTDAGTSFTDHSAPCAPAELSATVGAFWLMCSGGSTAFVTTDNGADWTRTPTGVGGSQSCPGTIGARNADEAFAGGAGALRRVSTNGSAAIPSHAPEASPGCWTFIGFTNPATGFALRTAEAGSDSPNVLWRTIDGGEHWSRVTL